MKNTITIQPTDNIKDIEMDYLNLPIDIQKKVKEVFDISITKADILDKTVTPNFFPFPGKEAFIMEYGILCVNAGKEYGFAWFFGDPVAQAKCKNNRCNKVKFVKVMYVSTCKTKVYCSDECKQDLNRIDIHITNS